MSCGMQRVFPMRTQGSFQCCSCGLMRQHAQLWHAMRFALSVWIHETGELAGLLLRVYEKNRAY